MYMRNEELYFILFLKQIYQPGHLFLFLQTAGLDFRMFSPAKIYDHSDYHLTKVLYKQKLYFHINMLCT